MNKEYSYMGKHTFLLIDRYGNSLQVPCNVWDSFYKSLRSDTRCDLIVPTMKSHKTKKDLIDDVRKYLRGEL